MKTRKRQVRHILAKMTEDQKSNARHAWSCICEGVDLLCSHADMKELQDLGLIEELSTPSGRGRYAKRYTFSFTNDLERVIEVLSAVKSAGI